MNKPNKPRGRPKVEKPLVSHSFKIDKEKLDTAIEIHGSKKVNQKVRDTINRLSK